FKVSVVRCGNTDDIHTRGKEFRGGVGTGEVRKWGAAPGFGGEVTSRPNTGARCDSRKPDIDRTGRSGKKRLYRLRLEHGAVSVIKNHPEPDHPATEREAQRILRVLCHSDIVDGHDTK